MKFLSSKCIFVEKKPYCDGCGRRAFVQSMLRKKSNQ